MNRERIKDFITWADQQSAIRSLLLTGEGVNRAAPEKSYRPIHWVLGVTDPKAYAEVLDEFFHKLTRRMVDPPQAFAGKIVQALVRPYAWEEGTLYHAHFLTMEGDLMILDICKDEDLPKFLGEESLVKVCLDKDDQFEDFGEPNDLSRRQTRPSGRDLMTWSRAFFEHIAVASLYLLEDALLPAQLALDRSRQLLFKMTRAAVAKESDFTLNPGTDMDNLEAYMDPAAFDHLARSYAFTKNRKIWDAIFQSCMLFRKEGLQMDDYDGFKYPKRLDVDTMKFLRKGWEESR